jgi:hypothetical protein
VGRQTIGARQIQHAEAVAGAGGERAFLALDGHAGVVGHLLARAGQAVEQAVLPQFGLPSKATMGVRDVTGACGATFSTAPIIYSG